MYEHNLLLATLYFLSDSLRYFKYDQDSGQHDILNYAAKHEHTVASLLVDSRDIVQKNAEGYNPGYKSDVKWKNGLIWRGFEEKTHQHINFSHHRPLMGDIAIYPSHKGSELTARL